MSFVRWLYRHSAGLADNTYDVIVSFQVIEHIEDDKRYLQEIQRVLKPGGVALLTTPNIKQSLSRNPWHEREYTASQLTDLAKGIFGKVEMKGIAGSAKMMQYHDENRKSVNKIMKWDFLDLQHKLPAAVLRVPYDILNRMNRNKLLDASSVAAQIRIEDFSTTSDADNALDLFLIAVK